MSSSQILVIGDLIADCGLEGTMTRISPEAPSPVICWERETLGLGGAGNVARNITALGGSALLLSAAPRDANGEAMRRLLDETGIGYCLAAGNVLQSACTAMKLRITCGGQQVLRIDRDGQRPGCDDELLAGMESVLSDGSAVKLVVVSDYGKGTMSGAVIRSLMQFCRQRQLPLFVDCKPDAVMQYCGATLFKPNAQEALTALHELGDVHPGLSLQYPQYDVAAVRLREHCAFSAVVITLGARGCVYYDPSREGVYECAASPHFVYDVCGAGDTVLAALAVGYLEGLAMPQAVELAMDAAGLVVQQHGVTAPDRDEVDEYRYQKHWAGKIMSEQQLQAMVRRRRRAGHRIVLANGCFDGLHAGHIQMLRFGKQPGDVTLVAAYNDDDSLRALKGTHRPLVPSRLRAEHLAQLTQVDAVTEFNGDVEQLVRAVRPDMLLKGERAMQEGKIPGADFVASYGGELLLAPHLPGMSSSRLGENV